MRVNIPRFKRQVKAYFQIGSEVRVLSVEFADRFFLFGSENVVLSVKTMEKRQTEWWAVGGGSPLNVYSKRFFRSPEDAFTMHVGLILRLRESEIMENAIKPWEDDYDAFISHASEDKKEFVRPLAKHLERFGLRIWYDEFTLRVGDSLRQTIDRGLIKSRYAIVVLSPHFFAKKWTNYELNGLTAREIDEPKVILPIWYKTTRAEILKFSPPLADKLGINADRKTVKAVATELVSFLKETSSSQWLK